MASGSRGKVLGREEFFRILADLFGVQQLAVLSTRRGEEPYLSLVGFTSSEDLKTLLFATPRATRKHENIRNDPRVALLIDSRTNRSADFKDAVAVTAYGTAAELEGAARAEFVPGYVDKFPHLEEFVTSPSCSLIKVAVSRYSLVRRFQDVVELDLD